MASERKASNPSFIYSTISIAIVLFLLAVYGLLFMHATNVSKLIQEKINIIVELTDERSADDLEELLSLIEAKPEVRSGSVGFVPKEQALITMKEFLSEVEGNPEDVPFKDVITFNFNADSYSDDNILMVKNDLEGQKIVLDVFAENETVTLVKKNVRKVSYITLLVGAIFVFLSLAIIYNTMKLKLHADRLEIKTMQLVGATRIFIAKPYIMEAIQLGFRAFLIVSTLVLAFLASLYFNVEGFSDIINWIYTGIVLIGVFVVGITLTVGVTRYVVQGYLNTDRLDLV